jgi:RNA polymerase subunit RPABC4/transcription elongation factor Spt4
MSLLEDLFDGRRHGAYRSHGHHDDGHDDRDHNYDGVPGRHAATPADARVPQSSCSGCETIVPLLPGYRFCPYCGSGLKPLRACATCGAVRTPGATFCPSCGAKL